MVLHREERRLRFGSRADRGESWREGGPAVSWEKYHLFLWFLNGDQKENRHFGGVSYKTTHANRSTLTARMWGCVCVCFFGDNPMVKLTQEKNTKNVIIVQSADIAKTQPSQRLASSPTASTSARLTLPTNRRRLPRLASVGHQVFQNTDGQLSRSGTWRLSLWCPFKPTKRVFQKTTNPYRISWKLSRSSGEVVRHPFLHGIGSQLFVRMTNHCNLLFVKGTKGLS